MNVKKILLLLVTISWHGTGHLYGWKDVGVGIQNRIRIFANIAEDTDVIVWAGDREFTAADFIKQGYTPVRFWVKNLGDEPIYISSKSLICDHSFNINRWTAQIKYHEIWRPLIWCIFRGIPLLGVAGAATIQAMYEDINEKAARGHGNAYFSSKETYTNIALCGWALTVLNLVLLTPYHWLQIKEANTRLSNAIEGVFCLNPTIVPPSKEINKVYLVPNSSSRSVGFNVFGVKPGVLAATFKVDYQNLK